MNNLRTFLVIAVMSLYVHEVSAQNPYFGVKGGLNMSHMKLSDNSSVESKFFNFSPGFNAGGTMDYRIIPELTVNVSIMVSQKGYSERRVEEFQGVEVKSIEALQLYYAELPIYFKHEVDFGKVDVFVGLGGFVSYGYWGKYRWRREGGGEVEWGKDDVNWGDDPDIHDYTELDYGASVNGGVKFDRYVLDFGYNYSLPNIAANNDIEQVAKNRVLYVSFNVFFSRFYKYNEGSY